jgi:DUF2946 family protein
MHRRLKKFLPIFVIALAVQLLAPIAACWAASLAIADPIAAAEICKNASSSGTGQSDQSSPHLCCSACSVLQTGAVLDTPEPARGIVVERRADEVVWHDFASVLSLARMASDARARAPPVNS